MFNVIAPILLSIPLQIQVGPSSHYRPGDGHNAGTLACGGTFTSHQNHIAHRRWRRLGCGRKVLVIAPSTGRSAMSEVRDAGPFGTTNAQGAWRLCTKYRPPKGWRWRGLTDLSTALWKKLSRPKFLSQVVLVFVGR